MILLIDLGNSRGKWQLWMGSTMLCSGYDLVVDDIEFVKTVHLHLAAESCGGLQRIIVSSVASAVVSSSLCQFLVSSFGVDVEPVVVERQFSGVEAGYDHLADLGVDRWLALIAARHQFDCSCLVVDAGTAITLDVIDAQGKHLGGMIAPGLNLVSDSLNLRTAKVRFDCLTFDPHAELGVSTQSCVDLGVSMMVYGFVAESLRQWSSAVEKIVWTGGNAGVISSLFPHQNNIVCESLVFDGLRIWANNTATPTNN